SREIDNRYVKELVGILIAHAARVRSLPQTALLINISAPLQTPHAGRVRPQGLIHCQIRDLLTVHRLPIFIVSPASLTAKRTTPQFCAFSFISDTVLYLSFSFSRCR